MVENTEQHAPADRPQLLFDARDDLTRHRVVQPVAGQNQDRQGRRLVLSFLLGIDVLQLAGHGQHPAACLVGHAEVRVLSQHPRDGGHRDPGQLGDVAHRHLLASWLFRLHGDYHNRCPNPCQADSTENLVNFQTARWIDGDRLLVAA